jgi:translation initiation factor 2 subunit 1
MRKSGLPSRNEIVVCRIEKIYPNSVSAQLVEYNKNGMIHVSEVAKRWIRDIREFVRENQIVACRVMRVEGDHIELSIKRVYREDSGRKLNEFKREGKAEKMLELAAKDIKKTLDQAYDEIGNEVEEEFGSLTKLFETAVKKPELLKAKGIPQAWLKTITETAKKKFVEKTYEARAELSLVCYRPDGVNIIRNVVSRITPDDMVIKYISAPKYVLASSGKNHKKIRMSVEETADRITKEINKQDGDCSFKMLE